MALGEEPAPSSASFPPLAAEPLVYEGAFWHYGLCVVGIDEAGRGPLAGPVVSAAVVLKEDTPIEGAADSKAMTAPEREEAYGRILNHAAFWTVGAASAREIDRRNILAATTEAMRRALASLPDIGPRHVAVDGLPVKRFGVPHDAIVGGDGIVHSISCASIVAKVTRDRLMCRLAQQHPGYGWTRNMGYGTREHRDAIQNLGPTPHHRLTFLGVQGVLGL